MIPERNRAKKFKCWCIAEILNAARNTAESWKNSEDHMAGLINTDKL